MRGSRYLSWDGTRVTFECVCGYTSSWSTVDAAERDWWRHVTRDVKAGYKDPLHRSAYYNVAHRRTRAKKAAAAKPNRQRYFDVSESGVLFVCPCGWRHLADDTDAAETAAWQHLEKVGGKSGDHLHLAQVLQHRKHRRQKAGTHA